MADGDITQLPVDRSRYNTGAAILQSLVNAAMAAAQKQQATAQPSPVQSGSVLAAGALPSPKPGFNPLTAQTDALWRDPGMSVEQPDPPQPPRAGAGGSFQNRMQTTNELFNQVLGRIPEVGPAVSTHPSHSRIGRMLGLGAQGVETDPMGNPIIDPRTGQHIPIGYRTKGDLIAAFLDPLSQSLGAALLGPRYQRNQNFWGNLLMRGVPSAERYYELPQIKRAEVAKQETERMKTAGEIMGKMAPYARGGALHQFTTSDPQDPNKLWKWGMDAFGNPFPIMIPGTDQQAWEDKRAPTMSTQYRADRDNPDRLLAFTWDNLTGQMKPQMDPNNPGQQLFKLTKVGDTVYGYAADGGYKDAWNLTTNEHWKWDHQNGWQKGPWTTPAPGIEGAGGPQTAQPPSTAPAPATTPTAVLPPGMTSATSAPAAGAPTAPAAPPATAPTPAPAAAPTAAAPAALPTGPIPDQITREANAVGVSPALALAVARQETQNFDPSVVSKKGAIGIMQLMPNTARELGVDPHDPNQNISGGVKYLKEQLDNYEGDVPKALAAYNAGPGAVDEAVAAGGDNWLSRLPQETQNYVPSVLRMAGQGGGAGATAAAAPPPQPPFGPQSPAAPTRPKIFPRGGQKQPRQPPTEWWPVDRNHPDIEYAVTLGPNGQVQSYVNGQDGKPMTREAAWARAKDMTELRARLSEGGKNKPKSDAFDIAAYALEKTSKDPQAPKDDPVKLFKDTMSYIRRVAVANDDTETKANMKLIASDLYDTMNLRFKLTPEQREAMLWQQMGIVVPSTTTPTE